MELLWAVLVASFLGSLHCAGMCGGVVAFIAGSSNRSLTQVAYHLGRAVSYSIMGAICGVLGAAIDLGGAAVGVGQVAMMAAGCIMIAYGVGYFLQIIGVRLPSLPGLGPLNRFFQSGHQASAKYGPFIRGLLIGLLSVLLPCGWLYVFAATAAASANPIDGALTMFVFWLGTVPVLLALGAGIQKALGPLRKRLPHLMAIALVAIGLLTLSGRLAVPSFAEKFTSPKTAQEGIDAITHPDAPPPACCESEAESSAN